MKTSLAWLNSYLDRPVNADEAQRVLTQVGFPIDSIDTVGADTVLEVEVTSNRPDCLSHVGLAREVAAATGRRFLTPTIELPPAIAPPVSALTTVTHEAPDLCPAYTARILRGVKIGPSPEWLVERLVAVGLRPINNVVDVTNFVLLELGQPLHAFDLAKLDGKRIVVRRAREGETMTAIDGSALRLKPAMLVIADASRPQAVAGVMGGAHSEVTPDTTDVLLESARFDPLSVRSTGRALKLASDSSYRFERGVDPRGLELASRRAAQLIVQLAGGMLAAGVVTVGEAPPPHRIVQLRPQRVNDLLGIDVPMELMQQFLAALGFEPFMEEDLISCTVPSYRLDVRREIDLVEEIARMHGFDHIPVQDKMQIIARRPQPAVEARKLVGQTLVAHGYHETITFSFLPPKLAAPFAGGLEVVKVDEEKKKAEPALRPSLLPSLLACRKANQDAGNVDVKLFEVAQTFGRSKEGYVDRRKLALLCDAKVADPGLRTMRGTLEELLHAMGLAGRCTITPANQPVEWAQPAAEIAVDGKPLGTYGPASTAILRLFDLQTPVILAELNYELLTSAYPPQPVVTTLPRFPAIERDLSVIVEERTPWAEIEAAVRRVNPALMERLNFVTTYRGKPVPAGRKSVTLRMTFRDPARTLQHDEVTSQVDAVVAELKRAVGAELRV